MSEENVEMIRRSFQAYQRGDLDAFVADFAPDCEYIAAGTVPGRTGTYRGPEGYKEFVAWLTFTFWQVWAFANGKIVSGRGFADKADALEAVGLSQ
jgi:ketosteroid isomerase-like protein